MGPNDLVRKLHRLASYLETELPRQDDVVAELRRIVAAMHVPGGWLRVFDFDDTLAVTEGRVHMTHPETKDTVRMKTPNWRAEPEYKDLTESGYEQDFRDFLTYLKDPKALKKYPPILQELVKSGKGKTIILTARTDTTAVRKWLQEMHLSDVECIGVGGSTPKETADRKADVIRDMMMNDGYRNVQFWDDSGANIEAVNELKKEWDSIHSKTYGPANIQSIRVPKPKSDDIDPSKAYVGEYS